MRIKTSFSRKVFLVFDYILLAAIAFVCVLPIWHVIMASFSDPMHVMTAKGAILWPVKATIEGYKLVFANSAIWKGYLNTIIYVSGSVILGMIITLLGAYACSRTDFLWRNVIMFFLSITMLFNGGIIPTYMVVKNLGLYNTPLAVIIPGCFSVFNMIMMRTAFQAVPADLTDAAKLDGAGHLTTLFRVMLPVTKATAAVIVLYYAVAQWNGWFNAAIYLRKRELYPLQLILREILIQNSVSTSIDASSLSSLAYSVDMYKELVQYCTIVVAVLPILVIYPFIQKYFEKGVMIGSVKG